MQIHNHKQKKKPHFKRPKKDLRQCKLVNIGLQEGIVRYEPGSIFYFEQKYDQAGHAYMRVYRTKDAESYWPFSLPDFYHAFRIIR